MKKEMGRRRRRKIKTKIKIEKKRRVPQVVRSTKDKSRSSIERRDSSEESEGRER